MAPALGGERGVFITSCSFCSVCCKTAVNRALKGNRDTQDPLCPHPRHPAAGLEPAQLGQQPSCLVPGFGLEEARTQVLLKDTLEQGVSERQGRQEPGNSI